MKFKALTIIAITALFASGCFKTKTCNLTISEEEKSWFPYDSAEQPFFKNQSGDTLRFQFSRIIAHADEEVTEGNPCRADAISYINMTDSTGSKGTIGQYLLLKAERGGGTAVSSIITLGDIQFYQNDYQDDNLKLDRNGNTLKVIDSLPVSDTTYHDVLTIAEADTMLYTTNVFQNVYFTKDFRILKFELQQSATPFELINPGL